MAYDAASQIAHQNNGHAAAGDSTNQPWSTTPILTGQPLLFVGKHFEGVDIGIAKLPERSLPHVPLRPGTGRLGQSRAIAKGL